MLAPEELASLRAVGAASLSGVCDVKRITRTRLPNNSWKEVLTDVYTAIPCRQVPTGQTPQEVAIMEREATRGFSTFLLEGATELYGNDVIVYGGKSYPLAGVLGRTDQIYERVMVYDDSAAPTG